MRGQICLKTKTKTDKTQAYTKTLPLTDADKHVTGAVCRDRHSARKNLRKVTA